MAHNKGPKNSKLNQSAKHKKLGTYQRQFQITDKNLQRKGKTNKKSWGRDRIRYSSKRVHSGSIPDTSTNL